MKEAIRPVADIGLFTDSILPKPCKALEKSITYGYKFQPARALLFNNPKNNKKVKEQNEQSLKNLLDNHVKGYLSDASRQRVKSVLYAWSYAIKERNELPEFKHDKNKKRIVMLTLTLSSRQRHPDKQIKKDLLIRFIEDLKRIYNVKHYFWKAEAQKNGNIHFHSLIDEFLPYLEIRTLWNKHQEHLGYITEFIKAGGHTNPNSTDIHAKGNDINSIRYLFNYTLKDEKNRPIEGRICGYSDVMNDIKEKYGDVTPEIGIEIERLRTHKKVKVIEKENYVYFDLSLLTTPELKNLCPIQYRNYLETTFENITILGYLDG